MGVRLRADALVASTFQEGVGGATQQQQQLQQDVYTLFRNTLTYIAVLSYAPIDSVLSTVSVFSQVFVRSTYCS